MNTRKTPLAWAQTDVVQGPIFGQLAVMYFCLIVAIIVAWKSGLAAEIRSYNLIPIITASALSLEVPRLVGRGAESIFRFYSTLLPFVVFTVSFREVHAQIAVLYFCATMAICLQNGIPLMKIHAVIYVCLFLALYSCSVVFMMVYFVDIDNSDPRLGKILSPPIDWTKEVTVMIAMMVLGIGFLMLERFVHVYSRTLLRRKRQFQKLQSQHQELKREIKEIHRGTKEMLDVESPLTKALSAMRAMSVSKALDENVKKKLAILMAMLSQANKLYAPDLTEVADRDVGDFLNTMLGDAGPMMSPRSELLSQSNRRRTKSSSRFPDFSFPSYEAESHAAALLSNLESWDFDVLELDRLSGGHALYLISTALFAKYGFGAKYFISDSMARRFCAQVESGYHRENPYHNAAHAADVLQCLNYFLVTCGITKYLTELEVFGAVLAAMSHDLQHPGLNNAFHVAKSADIAITYNDRGVLENLHSYSLFNMLSEVPEANVLSGLNDVQYRDVRETIVTMILGTDLSKHFDLLSKFKAKLSTNGFGHPDRVARLLILSMAIKAADICNACRTSETSKRWADKVMEEFWRQGDAEKKLGMPVSAYMDREKPSTAKCQAGFIEYIVAPLYEAWLEFIPDQAGGAALKNNMKTNLEHWRWVISEMKAS